MVSICVKGTDSDMLEAHECDLNNLIANHVFIQAAS